MSNWNGKLKCIKSKHGDLKLKEGKVYEVKNGILTYDDGFRGCIYENFQNFMYKNPTLKDHLIEIKDTSTNETDWNIEQSKLAKYIMINDKITIAIPVGTPIGISFKHPDDGYSEEIGQALALKRLYEQLHKQIEEVF